MMRPQVTLGELRDALASASPDAQVRFDQFGLLCRGLDSWRGVYALPAVGWCHRSAGHERPTVAGLLARVDRALAGQVFVGWKGGNYTYGHPSPIWVDNPGEVSDTALVGVTVGESDVTLHTEHREYGS